MGYKEALARMGNNLDLLCCGLCSYDSGLTVYQFVGKVAVLREIGT